MLRLDEKPELLFVLRKVDHLELIAGAVDSAPVAKLGKSRGKKTIATSDLADVFGIEMTGEETHNDALLAIAKEPAKPRVPATKKVAKQAPEPPTVTKAKKASAAPAAKAKQSKPKTAKARPQPASPAPAKSSSRKRVKQEVS